MSLTNF